METPELLRLLYKYYGGINFFKNKNLKLLVDCVSHAIEKEMQIPKMINKVIDSIKNKDFKSEFINKNMRSAEEIMKDYGLGG